VTQTLEGVAHFAHLGGMLGGWLLLQYWLPRRRATGQH
jgi:membrane associated rhomboid family serine protease